MTDARDAVATEVARVKHWRHQIALPGGVVTPGSTETASGGFCFGIPQNLEGKTVLDIGCSDGFFSFECERRGAARIVAVDDFSSVYVDSPAGFHVAHKLLESHVEFVQGDFVELDLRELGQFDLVLCLGVLYHLRHPLLALERLAEVCKEQLIIETLTAPPVDHALDRMFAAAMARLFKTRRRSYAHTFRGQYMEFYERDEIGRDPTNWWAPSLECLKGMLRSCGFCAVSVVEGLEVVHAFSPRHGTDVRDLVATCEAEVLNAAFQQVVGRRLDHGTAVQEIQELSITQFGRVKQRARVIRAKQWHQGARWSGNTPR